MLRAALLFAIFASSAPVGATPIESALSGASKRGEATYRYLGLPLYEATLYTAGGQPFDWNKEFGLELRYRRNLTQYDLVEGTMRELDRTGSPLPVRQQLEGCFSSVSKGDRYLAVTDGPNRIGFWRNGQRTCNLSHPQIKYRFMGIFLGENSRSSSFTRRLRGQ